MFTSLSKAITLKTNATETVPKQTENIVDLPEDMKLEAIDDWDTIDDKMLSKIIQETSENVQNNDVQQDDPKTSATVPVENAKQPAQNQIQANFNTINNTSKRQVLPHMYFPNSNVTINYHFHK